MKPLIAIPAAGASSRMRGRDKLLEPVDGVPLLRRQTMAAVNTGHPVLVLIPPGSPRAQALAGLNAKIAIVENAREGMAASLRQAVVSLHKDQPLAILLPDVPGVTTKDIAEILTAFSQASPPQITRASDPDNRPGTPLVLPFKIARRFATLSGDEGGRSILADHPVSLHAFPDTRATHDLDTPEDWADWRAKHTP